MDGRDNRRMILHIMAGGYLMYLAYGIGKGNLSGETPENRLLLMWICAAVFGAVGAALLIHALYAWVRDSRKTSETAADSVEEEPEAGQEETETADSEKVSENGEKTLDIPEKQE